MENKKEKFGKRDKSCPNNCKGAYKELAILIFAEAKKYLDYETRIKTIKGAENVPFDTDVVFSTDVNYALDLKPYKSTKNFKDESKSIINPSLTQTGVQDYFKDYRAIGEQDLIVKTEGSDNEFVILFSSNTVTKEMPADLNEKQKKLFICLWLAHEIIVNFDLNNFNKKEIIDSSKYKNIKKDYIQRYSIKDKTFRRYQHDVFEILEAISIYIPIANELPLLNIKNP